MNPHRTASALLAIAIAMVFVATTGTANAAVQPLRTGVSYIYDVNPIAFENVKRAGTQMVMTPLRWGQVAPSSQPSDWQPENPADPHYDWEPFDREVQYAVAAGLTPVLQVRGAPVWAQRCQGKVEAPCNPDPAALAAFATAAAQRYSGHFAGLPRVQYWQGLNEPNLSFFFDPQWEGGKAVSPFLYRALINSFYAAVKAVDPSNLVIAAGLGPIGAPNSIIPPMRFARLLLCMRGREHPRPTGGNCEGGVHFDIFDIHPYTSGGPTHEGNVDDVELGDLHKLKTLLAAADRAGRIVGQYKHTPLWIMEFSWDSNPPDPGGLEMKIETRWTAEALHHAWSTGIHTFFWYSLRDAPSEPQYSFSETFQSGLYFRGPTLAQDQPKEVFYAFRFPFVAYPTQKGLSFWGRTPSNGPGKLTIQVREGGKWRGVMTTRADEAGIFRGLAPKRYGRNKRGAARAVFRGEASVPFSMRPVPDFFQPPFG